MEARQAHNLEVGGSNPSPATIAPELDITPVKIVRRAEVYEPYGMALRRISRLPVLRNRSGSPGFNLSGKRLRKSCLAYAIFESVAPNGRASAVLKTLDAHEVDGSNLS